jgi:DNA repair exonuclease SbcCD ATPase subunit
MILHILYIGLIASMSVLFIGISRGLLRSNNRRVEELEESRNRVHELGRRLRELEPCELENKKLKNRNTEIVSKNKSLSEQLQELEVDFNNQGEVLNRVKADRDKAYHEKDEVRAAQAITEADLSKLQSEYDGLLSKYNALLSDYEKLQLENSELRQKLSGLEALIAEKAGASPVPTDSKSRKGRVR